MDSESFVTVFFCGTIFLLLYYYLTATFQFWKERGVKGPKPIPGFGNIYDVFMTNTSMGEYLKKLYEEYRNEPVIGIYDKREPILVLRDAELIKDVLIKDFSYFPERDLSTLATCERAEPLSVHLFRLEAERWRLLRTRLSPVFTSGKLKEMFHLLLGCSEHLEKYLRALVDKGEPLECREVSAKYTTDVIGSCAFGIEMNSLTTEESEFRKMGRKVFRIDFKTMARERCRASMPNWMFNLIGGMLVDQDVTEFFTRLTMDSIDYRKRNNLIRNDFMDILTTLKDHPEKLKMTEVPDYYVAAQAFVFFAAGFETSASTMSHALYELALNPHIQDKVRLEIDEVLETTGGKITYDSIKEMKYLDMFFREVLRKYPIVMYLVRTAIKEYTFQSLGFTVPKGQKIIIPVLALQNDPDVYPNPEVTDPERFSDEMTKSRNPMYFLAFGDGPRNCIGARFAYYQSKVGLITILRNYKVDVCEKTQIPYKIKPKHAFMLQPDHDIYLKMTDLVKG